MLVALARDAKRLYGVLAVICLSLGFHATKAGLAFLLTGGGTRFDDGLSGAFVDNNGYALGTVMILPMLLVTAQNIELVYNGRYLNWVRRGLYATVPLCVFTVLGTYSRGGFLAFSAALLTFVMLQRRRFTALAGLIAFFTLLLAVVPLPQQYIDRLSTIRTFNEKTSGDDPEGAKESAKSRTHFWQVGIVMAMNKPLGVGIKQDRGRLRPVRLPARALRPQARDPQRAPAGAGRARLLRGVPVGADVRLGLLLVHAGARARRDERLRPEQRRFLLTAANGLMASMAGFIIGGSFLSLAYNELTWLTFAMVAALDRLSVQLQHEPVSEPVTVAVPEVPLAFRAVPSYARR